MDSGDVMSQGRHHAPELVVPGGRKGHTVPNTFATYPSESREVGARAKSYLPSRSVTRATVSEMYSSFAGLQGIMSPDSLHY